jgi:hypothetical protein
MHMVGIDKALLRQLLAISGAWEIADYQLDLRKQRCDVWIGPQVERGWFGRPRKAAPVRSTQQTWQHLALGTIRFFLHVSAPVGVEFGKSPWTGDPGMPFTHALAQQVFVLFNEGIPLPAICKLMSLSINDVWRYRFALDNGLVQSQAAEPAVASPRPAPAASAARAPESAEAGGVPDVSDPVWLQLVNGDLKLDIRVLSLKLILTRVRTQLELISDDEVRLLKLRDLHRYFVKNARVLSHELAQLKAI